MVPGVGLFVPKWNLCDDSRLSIRANVIECTGHGFPLVVVADIDSMAKIALSYKMPYGGNQDMFYLANGSRRIQHLDELEHGQAGFAARESGYKL